MSSDSKSASTKRAELSVKDHSDGCTVFTFSGPLTTQSIGHLDQQLRALPNAKNDVIADLSDISGFDTAGAWLIERTRRTIVQDGYKFELRGLSDDAVALVKGLGSDHSEVSTERQERQGYISRLDGWFSNILDAFKSDIVSALYIIGSVIRGSQMKAGRSNAVSVAPIVAQIDNMGVGAVPIVVLMSTIIGAIIAQQGAFQLRFFGAEIYVVDLVGILVLREIGVLITAIMIAGRSGSAITAEIGSMKMREEVDALTVMGLNPIGVLVFPRLVALVISLPLLVMIANFAALIGAAAVSAVYSGISPDAFVARLREAIDMTSLLSGLIKAPFMALIIGIIATVEGLKVEGSAESLGRCVTRSVVKAIFVVIVLDGLFAMFYAAIGF